MYRLKAFSSFLILAISVFGARSAAAQREIPDDNLAYPVLITIGQGSGSGFFLETGSSLWLITAKHVLYNPQTQALLDPHALLRSYSKDPSDPTPNLVLLDLALLNEHGDVKKHPTEDVVAVKIYDVKEIPAPPSPTPAQPSPADRTLTPTRQYSVSARAGVREVSVNKSGFLAVDKNNAINFDKVLIGNDIIMFGYPVSLRLQQMPQLDLNRPLLRKGIVAGTNPITKSIILDSPSYFGNSGGPVMQIEHTGFGGSHLSVIGLVLDYVPFVQTSQAQTMVLQLATNSGYSIIAPMDFVFELVK